MTRVKPIQENEANNELSAIYKGIKSKMGKVPNIFLNMGNSSETLKGYLGLSDAASHTSLSPKIRELIALTVGQANNCGYCLSAHTAIAQGSGVTDQEILSARKGSALDPKTQAILAFTKIVVEKKGQVTDKDVATLKAAGVSDSEIVELILVITLNMFTNYFNHITDPKIDFPVAPKL